MLVLQSLDVSKQKGKGRKRAASIRPGIKLEDKYTMIRVDRTSLVGRE
jgi:hypothetical protein